MTFRSRQLMKAIFLIAFGIALIYVGYLILRSI